MRGTGEGSRPYDLRPNSSMTNATVAESVVSNDGRTLLIKYRGGEKKVQVSPETPVVTYVPADRNDLKPGAKVIAFMKKLPDGSFETNRVSVGRDGLTPPMWRPRLRPQGGKLAPAVIGVSSQPFDGKRVKDA